VSGGRCRDADPLEPSGSVLRRGAFPRPSGEYFEAIAHLDAELALHYGLDQPERDSLARYAPRAELDVGDLELSYRMNRRGGRAMERLLAKGVPEPVRDQAAWRLARLSFEKSEYEQALQVLDAMGPNADEGLVRKAGLLRGEVLLALGRPGDAARALASVDSTGDQKPFVEYNHAVALLRAKEPEDAYARLDRIGQMDVDDDAMAALRDKANLALGYTLLQAKRPVDSQAPLERVRLDGPFSNKALLWFGWGDAAQQHYQEALSAWMELRGRDPTDPAVQEALLAAPYAFSRLEAYGRAAVLYGDAVKIFGHQIDRLDESIRSIREGRFLHALVARNPEPGPDGGLDLGQLPDSAPTRYLADLMAGRPFQQAWLNYRDLSGLLKRVRDWQFAIPAFRDLIAHRRAYYEPILPGISQEYDRLDVRLKQIRSRLGKARDERDRLLRKRDPMALATSEEHELLDRLDRLRQRLPKSAPDSVRHRINRLSGVIRWRVLTGYPDRLSAFHEHIRVLASVLKTAEATRFDLLKRKESVPLLYQGYGPRLKNAAERLEYLETRIKAVRDQEGRFIEQMAIAQLNARKQRLRRYQTKARFAAAENYDRATSKEIRAPTEQAPGKSQGGASPAAGAS